jgi:membrane-bound lytic murein transglycosylase D
MQQLPMKLKLRINAILILLATAYSGFAQQKNTKIDSVPASPFTFPNAISADTASVPLVDESLDLYNFNLNNKKRLDSIRKAIPLDYNEYVQKYIDVYTSRKNMMGKMLGLSSYYFPIFEQALKSYDVPDELKYLPIIESSMNPHAVSRVGATGLWQFMFTTAKGYGLNMDNFVDERKDPVQASYAAAAYFRDAYQELGDWLLAIAAYNCGAGNVNRAIAKANSRDFWEIRPFLPQETRNYVPAFIAAIYVMNFASQHQILEQKSPLAIKTDTVQVNHFVSLTALSEALEMETDALFVLNPSYKKKIVNGTEESPKRIIMPSAKLTNFAMIYEVLNNTPTDVDTRVILASNDDKRLRNHKRPAGTGAKAALASAYHKVRPGQNLSNIADQYNVEVQDLKAWNKLKGSTIVPGQRLIISKKLAPARTEAKSGKRYISYKRSEAKEPSSKI